MEFDTFALVLLRSGPAESSLGAEELDRLQDAHLAHLADLHGRGHLVAAGPARLDDDATLRGIALFATDTATAAALMAEDPSVLAQRFTTSTGFWTCPADTLRRGPGRLPSSMADVLAEKPGAEGARDAD